MNNFKKKIKERNKDRKKRERKKKRDEERMEGTIPSAFSAGQSLNSMAFHVSSPPASATAIADCSPRPPTPKYVMVYLQGWD